MKRILLVVALAFILPNASPAMADGHGKEGRKHYQEREREDRKFYEEQAREERKFREKQEREARKFYEEQEREARKFYEKQEREEREHLREMKRDAKNHDKDYRKHSKGKLPPDWRKRVEKDRRLDDDIYVQLEPVPQDIRVVLPPPPPGVSYRQIENEIIKIDEVNRKILDVLEKTGLPLPPVPPLPHLR